jgi:hypothetical protein
MAIANITNNILTDSGVATSALQIALNGTGFVKIVGTTISYDNSTYLTTSAAASTYLALAGGTLTGALSGTSATFSGDVTISKSAPRYNFIGSGVDAWIGGASGRIYIADTATATFGAYWDMANGGYTQLGTGANVFNSSVTAASFFESSDSRLKTLIQDNYQTKGIASITPKLYTKNGKVELGYYAQDFVGVLDSAVSKGSDDMLSLSYREVLVAKVYALEQRIKELETK